MIKDITNYIQDTRKLLKILTNALKDFGNPCAR